MLQLRNFCRRITRARGFPGGLPFCAEGGLTLRFFADRALAGKRFRTPGGSKAVSRVESTGPERAKRPENIHSSGMHADFWQALGTGKTGEYGRTVGGLKTGGTRMPGCCSQMFPLCNKPDGGPAGGRAAFRCKRRGSDREDQSKGGPLPGPAVDFHPPPVVLHDAEDGGKAQPDAVSFPFGGEKRLEDIGQVFR